jgi:hypothetical protein
MLIGFALSGYGAFVLVRMVARTFIAAFAGGVFYAFVSFKFDHLAHLQIISSGWIPLTLAAFFAYWRKPDWKRALALSAALTMNGLTNIYFLLFTAAALGATIIVIHFAGARRTARFWAGLAGALLLSGTLLLPFLIPYRIVSKTYNLKRPEGEVLAGAVDWADWLRANVRSRWYGPLIPYAEHRTERELFPGLMPLFLFGAAILLTTRRAPPLPGTARSAPYLRLLDILIVALAFAALLGAMAVPRFRLTLFGHLIVSVRDADVPMVLLIIAVLARFSIRLPLAAGGTANRTLRDAVRDSRFSIEAWIGVLWMVLGVLGTFSLKTFFYSFLFDRIEAYSSIRATGRWAVIAFVGLAIWTGLGIDALLEGRKGRRRLAVAALLCVLVCADVVPTINWEHAIVDVAPVYRFLGRERVGPVMEWPVDNWLAFRYLLGAAHHRVMLMNGSSGWEGPLYARMRTAWDDKKPATSFALAEQNGCRLLVVHAHWLTESERVRETLRQAVAAHRLEFLRRFDHGIEGDFVFAVTRNFPDWQRLRAPDVADGAGQLPEQQLDTFLAGEPTYNNSSFGQLETPQGNASGSLRVTGWAISPRGVKHVYVHVNDGRLRYEAVRTRRPEITHKFGWYYEEEPGFELVLPKRPPGVPKETDLQIEIIDGAGLRTFLDDQILTWNDPPSGST